MVGESPGAALARLLCQRERDALPLQQHNGRGPHDDEAGVGASAVLHDAPPAPQRRAEQEQLAGELVVSPWADRGRVGGAQEDGLEGRLGQDEVQQRGVVGLDEEEEDLLEGDVKESRARNDVAGIAPYAVADKVRIPGERCEHGDLRVSAEGGREGGREGRRRQRTVTRKETLKASSLVNSGR